MVPDMVCQRDHVWDLLFKVCAFSCRCLVALLWLSCGSLVAFLSLSVSEEADLRRQRLESNNSMYSRKPSSLRRKQANGDYHREEEEVDAVMLSES